MRRVFDTLGLLLAILSCVMLVRYGVRLGFVAPLQLALEWYEALMHFLFGWAEPYLNGVLKFVLGWTGWHLRLYPHWKHVFTLMWLYFAADAKVWSFDRRRAIFLFTLGGSLAFIASVAAGTVALNDAGSNVMMAAFAVGGVLLYGLGNAAFSASSRAPGSTSGYWRHFRYVARQPLLFAVVGIIIILLGTQVSLVKTLPSPGLAVLFVLIVALALYYILRGIWFSIYNRHGDESGWHRFRRDHSARLGFLMLEVIGGAAAFVLANGGLKLAGL